MCWTSFNDKKFIISYEVIMDIQNLLRFGVWLNSKTYLKLCCDNIIKIF